MCDDEHFDHAHDPAHVDESGGPTRRGLFRGAGAVAGALLLGSGRQLLSPARAYAASVSPTNAGGRTAFRHAMHVHTSFSEGPASLEAQLSEAALHGFDTLWTTDHDWRMSAYRAPDVFHFSGLMERVLDAPYTWRPAATGALATSSGATTSVQSPADAAAGSGSLLVSARSAKPAEATYRYRLDDKAANRRAITNLSGLTLALEVRPEQGGPDAWGTLELLLSYRPARSGRPAGSHRLVYRFGSAPAGRTATGLVGIVTVAAPVGAWTSVRLDPVADIAALWPDLVADDNHLLELSLGATSRRKAPAAVRYAFLRLTRAATDGDTPLQTQRRLIAAYAAQFPALRVEQGVEVSLTSTHSNWFGGDQHLIDYERERVPTDALAWSTAMIHGYGGLASLNHPFGSGGPGTVQSPSAQAKRRQAVAARLLERRVSGVDAIEVGYFERAGVDLDNHLALADTLWRSGNWVTATGVNDNHRGTAGGWARELNSFSTSLWQTGAGTAEALAALHRGEAFVGQLAGFGGFLDLNADGAPMGSASIAPGRLTSELTMTGIDLPSGSTVQVVRGPVDHSDALDPGTTVLAELPASAFAGGSATLAVPTDASCFVRLQVRAADGSGVAFTNPVFLLQEEPPAGRELPADRRVS